jgi:hypothetical protein
MNRIRFRAQDFVAAWSLWRLVVPKNALKKLACRCKVVFTQIFYRSLWDLTFSTISYFHYIFFVSIVELAISSLHSTRHTMPLTVQEKKISCKLIDKKSKQQLFHAPLEKPFSRAIFYSPQLWHKLLVNRWDLMMEFFACFNCLNSAD